MGLLMLLACLIHWRRIQNRLDPTSHSLNRKVVLYCFILRQPFIPTRADHSELRLPLSFSFDKLLGPSEFRSSPSVHGLGWLLGTDVLLRLCYSCRGYGMLLLPVDAVECRMSNVDGWMNECPTKKQYRIIEPAAGLPRLAISIRLCISFDHSFVTSGVPYDL